MREKWILNLLAVAEVSGGSFICVKEDKNAESHLAVVRGIINGNLSEDLFLATAPEKRGGELGVADFHVD